MQAVTDEVSADALDAIRLATVSMDLKITAASQFEQAGGRVAGVGRLQDAHVTVEGRERKRNALEQKPDSGDHHRQAQIVSVCRLIYIRRAVVYSGYCSC